MSRTRPARTSNSRDSVAGLPKSLTSVAPGAEKRSVIWVFIVALWMAASRDSCAMVRPIQRAGSRNSGISTSDSSVTCHEILSMTTSVSVSVTMLVMTPENVSEKARWAPVHVVAEPADEGAGTGAGEKGDGHPLHVVEDRGTQVEDQALADRRRQPPRHQRHARPRRRPPPRSPRPASRPRRSRPCRSRQRPCPPAAGWPGRAAR